MAGEVNLPYLQEQIRVAEERVADLRRQLAQAQQQQQQASSSSSSLSGQVQATNDLNQDLAYVTSA